MITWGIFGLISVALLVMNFFNINMLIKCMVFFAPFVTCYVFMTRTFYLKPSHFFLIALYAIVFGANLIILLMGKQRTFEFIKPNIFIVMLILSAIVSNINAYAFRIDESVYGIGNNLHLKSSLFSKQNLTQSAYLVCGFLGYYAILQYMKHNIGKYSQIIRTFALSGLFVGLIGIYQIIALKYGLPFQVWFKAGKEEMWQTMARLQSTMNEASIFGQFCVYMIVIFIWSDEVKKMMGDMRFLFVLLFIADGVITRSTTFMVGAVTVLLLGWLMDLKSIKRFITAFAVICLGVAIVFILYKNNEYMMLFVDSGIEKLTGKSKFGNNRLHIFNYMVNMWLKYPIFGIGYGGGRSTDLYSSILATMGCVGAFSLVGYVIRTIINTISQVNDSCKKVSLLLLIAFLATSVSVPDIIFMPLWVVLAIIDYGALFYIPKYE